MSSVEQTINPIYDDYAEPCTDRYLALFGGAGSGKSDYAAKWKLIINWFLSSTYQRVLIVRKYANTLNYSVWQYAVQTIKDLGLWSLCKVNKTLKSIIYEPTGNELIFSGVDDPEKLKSIFKITKVWIEEASELEEGDFLQIDLRLRGDVSDYFQVVLSFNPVNKEHWLVKYCEPQFLDEIPSHVTDLQYIDEDRKVWRFAVEDKEGNKLYTTTINSNYKDNKYIDAAYITRLKTLASIDSNFYQVYECGRWGESKTDDKYLTNFSEAVHIGSVKHIHELPIHYSTDFNVKPYMSGLCIQQRLLEDNIWEIRIFKEYALSYPRNEAFYLGSSLSDDFNSHLHQGVYLYGDASGNNKLGVKDTPSLFADVMKGFGNWVNLIRKRIPTHNPRYDKIAHGALGRRSFTNAVFSGKLPVKILIDRSCVELIKDLRLCKLDPNGRLAKPKNKEGAEERGHHLQALEYYICHPESIGYLAQL